MKKTMLYNKTLDDKIEETVLNSSRSHKSGGSSSSRSTNSNSFRFSSYLQNPNLNYADILMNANANRSNSEKFLNLDLDSKSDTNVNGDKAYVDYSINANDQDLQLTNRSLLLTNRTNKSVRFDDDQKPTQQTVNSMTQNSNIDLNEISMLKENSKIDPLTNQAVNERYRKLNELVSTIKPPSNSDDSPFSLSLPLTPRTPRSNDGLTIDLSSNQSLNESSFISKEMSKSLESLYKQHNETFVQE